MKNNDLESLNSTLAQKIDNHIDSGLTGKEALIESLSSISNSLSDLGFSENVINSIKTSSLSSFEKSLTDGHNIRELNS